MPTPLRGGRGLVVAADPFEIRVGGAEITRQHLHAARHRVGVVVGTVQGRTDAIAARLMHVAFEQP